jgi:putative endonuclease
MFLPFWRRAEIRAARFLRTHGYRLVASGYRVREGEVDLIAWDGTILVFVEVKSRRNTDPPESVVGMRKRARIVKAAHVYLARHRLNDVLFRFDIVAVNEIAGQPTVCKLLRDAF